MHYTWRVARPGQTLAIDAGTARSVGARRQRCALGSARSERGRTRPGDSLRAIVTPRTERSHGSAAALPSTCADAVIYEVHVGGFTRHPSAGVAPPGHLCRPRRKDPVPEGARRHARRADAGDGVRRTGRAAGGRRRAGSATTGATAPRLLRAASALLRRPGARRRSEFRDLREARCTRPASA